MQIDLVATDDIERGSADEHIVFTSHKLGSSKTRTKEEWTGTPYLLWEYRNNVMHKGVLG